MNCAILGVGLIGASIGKALLARGLADRVMGFGRDWENLNVALKSRCVTHITLSLEEAVREAHVVFVCAPVGAIPSLVEQGAEWARTGAIFTDTGSSKLQILRMLHATPLARGCTFVGAHPIAGKEISGAGSADENLFCEKLVVVTPTEETPEEAISLVLEIWEGMGARVCRMSAEEHDHVLAKTSHLPHLISCALSAMISPEEHGLAGTGFESMTRLAKGSPEVWKDIVRDNKDEILSALAGYQQYLQTLHDVIRRDDATALEAFLQTAKKNRNALGN
ncbi:MAG: prephenate dehydrogenase [Planctomycetia bacterium]|nr:prephenate dehydrogenase [Planctomycetia bacterium]